ncbi:MAG: hypothetical protein P8Z35_22125 [Ignavibacteriaceae bacterium]
MTLSHVKRLTIVCLLSTGSDKVWKNAPTTTRNDNPIVPLPIIPITFSFLIRLPKRPLNKKPASGNRIVK